MRRVPRPITRTTGVARRRILAQELVWAQTWGSAVRPFGSCGAVIPLRPMNYLLHYRPSPYHYLRSGFLGEQKSIFLDRPTCARGAHQRRADARRCGDQSARAQGDVARHQRAHGTARDGVLRRALAVAQAQARARARRRDGARDGRHRAAALQGGRERRSGPRRARRRRDHLRP